MASTLKKNIKISLIFFVLIQAILFFHKNIKSISANRQILYAPPAEAKFFAIGYSEQLADSFWLRVLQDIDLCEQNLAPVDAQREGKGHVANCDRGWVYHILLTVFESAPRWNLPARIGPMLLSVIVDDINGATILFKKAVENFPNDWVVLYRAGYHFLYETDDKLLAAQLYERAANNGAPSWAKSLSAKLYSETGKNIVARTIILDALNSQPAPHVRDKLLERLKKVESELSKNNKEMYR